MKVVLDTNVLLAGIFTRGVCERILDDCWARASTIKVIGSEHILLEFARNAETKFAVPADEATDAAAKLRHRLHMVEPDTIVADQCRDPDDLLILVTATAAQADYLVTGDKDLLSLNSF